MTNTEELRQVWTEININIQNLCTNINRKIDDITILAVSKTHPLNAVICAMTAGMNNFGENYAQELKDKYIEMDNLGFKQPLWHFIGHLQTNKVKYIAPFVEMIHSVDSFSLAQEISKQAIKYNRNIDILLQVNSSGEDSKSGCEPNEIEELAVAVAKLPNINICGLMTIGSFSNDERISRIEFSLLRNLKEQLSVKYPDMNLKHLSMGMTNDYLIAIEEGATIVRIGTAIFGFRDYSKK